MVYSEMLKRISCILLATSRLEAFTVISPRRLTFPSLYTMDRVDDDPTRLEQTEKALFGAGCFWAPQQEFNRVNGVISATTGYAFLLDDNDQANHSPPSYISVCSGDGRTEAVLVEYDPSVISYSQLLQTFWLNHDASVAEKPQYRSIIWPLNEEQQVVAVQDVEQAKEAYRKEGMNPPLTIVAQVPCPNFVVAESVHQNVWAKFRFKVACLAFATLCTTSHTPVVDPIVMTALTTLIVLWVLWEVSTRYAMEVP